MNLLPIDIPMQVDDRRFLSFEVKDDFVGRFAQEEPYALRCFSARVSRFALLFPHFVVLLIFLC